MNRRVSKLIKAAASTSRMENDLKRKYKAVPAPRKAGAIVALQQIVDFKRTRNKVYREQSTPNS